MAGKFYYRMTERPFGIGCQPEGYIEVHKGDGLSWNIIAYENQLSETEETHYGLSQMTKYEVKKILDYREMYGIKSRIL